MPEAPPSLTVPLSLPKETDSKELGSFEFRWFKVTPDFFCLWEDSAIQAHAMFKDSLVQLLKVCQTMAEADQQLLLDMSARGSVV